MFDHVLKCPFAGSENSNSNKFLTQPCQTITCELKLIAIMLSVTRLCSCWYLLFSLIQFFPSGRNQMKCLGNTKVSQGRLD